MQAKPSVLRSVRSGLVMAMLLVLVPVAATAGDSLKIAVVMPLTGPVAAAGDDLKGGVLMKADAVNAVGGVNGVKVEPVFYDDQCEPREAALVAMSIATTPDIVAIVGHMCSSAHLAALPTYLREGIPAVTPTATSEVISAKNRDEDGKVWSFRTVYRDDFQGKFLAKYMAKVMGLHRVALLYENSDYGLGLKKSFLKQARRRGLTVVGVEAYKKGDQDFTPLLTKLRAGDPQGLCIAGYYGEAALIANQARKVGLRGPLFGPDALDSPDYMRLAGPASEGTFMTAPMLLGEAGSDGQRFSAAYRERFHRDPAWMSAYAYDTMGVVLSAVAKAGPHREGIRDALAAMNSSETGFAGITGTLYFNAMGDCLRPAFVKMVRDGKFEAAPGQLD